MLNNLYSNVRYVENDVEIKNVKTELNFFLKC